MPSVPRIPAWKAIKVFQAFGWREDRIAGSHHILVKQGEIMTLSIPDHGKDPVGLGLLKKQITNAGLSVQEFIDMLEEI